MCICIQPRYFIMRGERFGCIGTNRCGNQCTNDGRYCAVDPEKDLTAGIDGMDVVQENLRKCVCGNI